MPISKEGSVSIRTTQRAPRSCISCTKRRRKCDKKIPCQQCINHGRESNCTREVVKVKGQIIADSTEALETQHKPPSYHQLLEENRQLKSQLLQPLLQLERSNLTYKAGRNITESFEKDLFEAVKNTHRTSTVTKEGDVIWPSSACASILLSYGKIWTSWIHCALHHPTFEAECIDFWENGHQSCGGTSTSLWLAVYFSFMSAVLLFMEEEEAIESGVPCDVGSVLVNWYDAALFYLHKGDFLRNPDIRSVQTIAILGIVFNNIGDSALHNSLWGCAIRIARDLKMGSDDEHPTEDILHTEIRRRLWWTLVLCEWIPIPYRIPCIYEADFQVEIPKPLDDDELTMSGIEWESKPRSIQYHIAMIQLSIIYHRFRCALRLSTGSAEEVSALVISTDECLANLISHLPQHLQGDEFNAGEHDDQEQPWISWQRTNISLILFYYRIVVNRVLQDQWVEDPVTFARTRSICLGSAQGIINLAKSYTGSVARHRPWATSAHVFSAGIILVVETRYHSHDAQDQYMDDIDFCIEFLEAVKDQSIIATHALHILQQQMSGHI